MRGYGYPAHHSPSEVVSCALLRFSISRQRSSAILGCTSRARINHVPRWYARITGCISAKIRSQGSIINLHLSQKAGSKWRVYHIPAGGVLISIL
jgi:hypothetical protein